jgi:hypothetical protein
LIFLCLFSDVEIYLHNLIQVAFEAGEVFLIDRDGRGGKFKFPDVLLNIILLGVDLNVRGHYFSDVLSVLF